MFVPLVSSCHVPATCSGRLRLFDRPEGMDGCIPAQGDTKNCGTAGVTRRRSKNTQRCATSLATRRCLPWCASTTSSRTTTGWWSGRTAARNFCITRMRLGARPSRTCSIALLRRLRRGTREERALRCRCGPALATSHQK